MIVRKILPQDFDNVLTLLRYQIGELERDDIYDHNTALDTMRVASTKAQYFNFVALENSRPVGFITGYGTNYKDYTNITIAHISNVFLLASHRNKSNFDQLYQSVEEWSKLAGVTYITAEITDIESIDSMLEQKLPKTYKILMLEI